MPANVRAWCQADKTIQHITGIDASGDVLIEVEEYAHRLDLILNGAAGDHWGLIVGDRMQVVRENVVSAARVPLALLNRQIRPNEVRARIQINL